MVLWIVTLIFLHMNCFHYVIISSQARLTKEDISFISTMISLSLVTGELLYWKHDTSLLGTSFSINLFVLLLQIFIYLMKLVLLWLLTNAVEFASVWSWYGIWFRAYTFLIKVTVLSAYAKDCLFRLKIDLLWLIKIFCYLSWPNLHTNVEKESHFRIPLNAQYHHIVGVNTFWIHKTFRKAYEK
jgi:hypothetical protein